MSFLPQSFFALSLGYAFNRSFYNGESIYNVSGDRERLADGAYVKFALQVGI